MDKWLKTHVSQLHPKMHHTVHISRLSLFKRMPCSKCSTVRILSDHQVKLLLDSLPQGSLILHFNIKNTAYKWQTSRMLCHMAAVCCVIKAESIHGAVWRWEADYLLVDRPSDWWWRGLEGQREIQFKMCYLMVEELEALLKEQFQKCNILFHILPHISDGAVQPHSPCWIWSLFIMQSSTQQLAWIAFPQFLCWALFFPWVLVSHSISKFCFLISFSETQTAHELDANSLWTKKTITLHLVIF